MKIKRGDSCHSKKEMHYKKNNMSTERGKMRGETEGEE
jgi:hypothetical protein